MKLLSKLALASILSLTIPAFIVTDAIARGEKGGDNKINNQTNSSTSLDAIEASHLTYMREKEKLARDVYLTFAKWYPDQKVFANIATKSEQAHTDTMRDKLAQYNIDDPNPDTNNLPESLGVFSKDSEWGWYFDGKFKTLTAQGSASELEALKVGAFIEELDMHDIADCPQVMVENGYDAPCGLNYTKEIGLINAYNFLIDGSERHLRAYVGQIDATGKPYEPQVLTQDEFDAILGR